MRCLTIILILLSVVFVGCEGVPLDTLLDQSEKDSTDIVSEITDCYTGLDIDAEAGEYKALFDKACVDAILGVSQVSDVEGVEIIETDLSTVLSSFSAGKTEYQYRFVSFDAVVNSYTSDKSALRLLTPDGTPRVTINLFVKTRHIDISDTFIAGQTYDFTVWIIEHSGNTIFAYTVDPADIDSGKTLFDDMGATLDTTIDAVIESMKASETYFVFKRIVITAPVHAVHNHTTASTEQDYQRISLLPYAVDLFNDKENHGFSVYPALSLFTTFDDTYEVGITYTFQLIVHPLSGRGFFDAKDIGVVTYLAP